MCPAEKCVVLLQKRAIGPCENDGFANSDFDDCGPDTKMGPVQGLTLKERKLRWSISILCW
jgi:hypothetical protein